MKEFKYVDEEEIEKIREIEDYNIKNDDGINLVNYIIYNNKDKILKEIIDKVDISIISEEGRSILYYPIKMNQKKIIDILIEEDKRRIGISILDIKDRYGLTPLHYVIQYNRKELIDKIITQVNKIQKDNEGNSIIGYAINKDRDEIANILIEKNNDWLIIYNKYKQTIIHLAAMKNKDDIIKKYLSVTKRRISDSINIQDTIHNATALYYIVDNNNKEMLEYILKNNKGIDINLVDYKGDTILSKAIKEDKYDIIKIIMKYYKDKINYNLYDIHINTPLHLILEKEEKYTEEIKEMIKYSNIYIKNIEGITVYDIIKMKNLDTKYDIKDKKNMTTKIKINTENNTRPLIGYSIDIISGLKYLDNKLKDTEVINVDNKLNFEMCEYNKSKNEDNKECSIVYNIIISNNNTIYMTKQLIEEIKKRVKSKKRYIIIFMIMKIEENNHANIVIIDKKKNTIERYDPYGVILSNKEIDLQLMNTMNEYIPGIKTITDKISNIGAQYIESFENASIVGDPFGFCIAWCILYADIRIGYNESIDNIMEDMMNTLLSSKSNFRDIIRLYSNNITKIRDEILEKSKINFNKYYNLEITDNDLERIVSNI